MLTRGLCTVAGVKKPPREHPIAYRYALMAISIVVCVSPARGSAYYKICYVKTKTFTLDSLVTNMMLRFYSGFQRCHCSFFLQGDSQLPNFLFKLITVANSEKKRHRTAAMPGAVT